MKQVMDRVQFRNYNMKGHRWEKIRSSVYEYDVMIYVIYIYRKYI